jgi:hypothetical protein
MGLMFHNIRHPEDKERKILRQDEQIEHRRNVTLRRTTIEEIELKRESSSHRKENVT